MEITRGNHSLCGWVAPRAAVNAVEKGELPLPRIELRFQRSPNSYLSNCSICFLATYTNVNGVFDKCNPDEFTGLKYGRSRLTGPSGTALQIQRAQQSSGGSRQDMPSTAKRGGIMVQ